MFVAFQKTAGGRPYRRYFKSWENAKKAMDKDIQDCATVGVTVSRRWDYFNASKGFYVYEAEGKTRDGAAVSWALLELYFED